MPKVRFLPFNVEVEVSSEETLFEAALKGNIHINASCGGTGSCNKCKVLLKEGYLKGERIEKEYYKACLSYPLSDVVIEVPLRYRVKPDLFTRPKIRAKHLEVFSRLSQRFGEKLDPPVRGINLRPPQPDLEDNRDDLQRVLDELKKEGVSNPEISLRFLQDLPHVLRKADFNVYIEVFEDPRHQKNYLLGVREAREKEVLGVAVDLGTTTVQMELVDMERAQVVASLSDYNPQIAYGEDVITRIEFTRKKGGLKVLSQVVRERISQMIKDLLEGTDRTLEQVKILSLSGNTVMIHLFLELEPKFLREAPYVPVATDFPIFKANELGWGFSEDTLVQIMPCKASYVGGDVVAGVTVTQMYKEEPLTVFIDLGTNGEIVVGNKDFLICAACSAGPAFEGGGIKHGTRFTMGAIEQISIDPDTLEPMILTVGKAKPIGICGSGMVSLVASMLISGIIDRSGKIRRDLKHPRIRKGSEGWEYVVVFKEEAQIKEDIVVTEVDIENIIRAKAAIFSGCKLLLESVGLTLKDIERVYLAGNFGTFIELESAITIGLLPDIERDKFYFLGNTSLIGARAALLYKEIYREMREVTKMMTYLDLSEHPRYMEYYVGSLFLPHTEEELFPSLKILAKKEEEA